MSFEPRIALDGGDDGLDFYRAICAKWKVLLKNGGSIFFEIGETQGETVSEILKKNAFSDIKIIKDMYGNDRIVRAIY